MIFAVDADAARQAVGRRRLGCPEPGCAGRLHPWGSAQARRVAVALGTTVQVTPDRVRCGHCRVSHVVLPAWYMPRRGHGVEVVGQALLGKAVDGQGHRRVAQTLGLAQGTVRGWLRGAARTASQLTAQAVRAVGVSADVWAQRSTRRYPAGELTAAIDALARAAAAFARPAPPAAPAPSATGIDYFALLGAAHRRAVYERLHLLDPGDRLPALPPWQVINLITRGRLLTPTAPGP